MLGQSNITYTPFGLNFKFELPFSFYNIGYHLPINMFQYFELKLAIYKFTDVVLSNNSNITFPSKLTSSKGTGNYETPN